MVIVLDAQVVINPAGKPIGAPIPVAPVVLWVIFVKAVLMHNVGADEAAPAVLTGLTIIVPVALPFPQPPDNAMV
jgi:hypothetical protein